MSQKAAVQGVKDEVNTSETAPVAEKSAPVAAKAKPSEPKRRAAAAVKKVAPKPKTAEKAVTEKPAKEAAAEKTAPPPKAPAKSVKKAAPVAKAKVVAAPKAEKPVKAKKPKLVRDSFTLPEGDYALFATLKQRALAAGIEVKKSELLRAALTLLANLEDAVFAKTIGLVERIKTGRPKK